MQARDPRFDDEETFLQWMAVRELNTHTARQNYFLVGANLRQCACVGYHRWNENGYKRYFASRFFQCAHLCCLPGPV